MQTIPHDADIRLSTVYPVRRRNPGGSGQRSNRGRRPLDILMIKAQSLIMVRVRADG